MSKLVVNQVQIGQDQIVPENNFTIEGNDGELSIKRQGVVDPVVVIDENGIRSDKVTFQQAGAGAVATDVQRKLRERVSVKDFGAVGDGVTDDYAAIQAACAAIQSAGGGTLVFPKGTYFVNQHRIDGGANANGIANFAFTGISGLLIEGNGSKIVMQGGWTRTADYTTSGFWYSYQNCIGFSFEECHFLTVRDLEIDGGAATITKGANAEGSSHGITLRGCYHTHLENLYVHHYCADGLVVRHSGPITAFKVSRYLSAVNCKFNNNARQGCTIGQLRWATFENCEFSYAGQTGTYGEHSPAAGVDIEPNYVHDKPQPPLFIAGDESTGDISFIGCGFVDNNGFEFVGSSRDSVQHPVQFFGCSFKNTNGNNPQVVSAMRTTRFVACNFDDVSLYPGYTFNDDNKTEVISCNLVSRYSNRIAILHVSTNSTLIVRDSEIYLNGTTPHSGTYRIYIQSAKTEFLNNYIFTSAAEYGGTTYDVIHLVQHVKNSSGNRWDTDLATAGKFFTLSYTNAVYVDDWIENTTCISPKVNIIGRNRVTYGTKGFQYLESSAAGNKIWYDSAAPTTGTWKRGDKVINTAPSDTGVAEWICTAAGTPGTWTASYVNKTQYNTSAQIQEVVTPYTAGGKANATVAFKSNNTSGSVILEVTLTGYQGSGSSKIVLGKYGSAAPVVLQNTGGNALTYNTGYDGGISVNIAMNLSNPVVHAKAICGGLGSSFSENLSITLS